jgi:hypothetical protein
MPKVFQRLLLAIGVVALITLLVEIGLSVGATMHGNTPTKVVRVTAGPYPLTVSFYQYPARAGFALPFAVAPQAPIHGPLSFDVSSIPDEGVSATPVHASTSPAANVSNGIQGAAEITVQGGWTLHITVNGPSGPGVVDVPITATAPPAIPEWLGWIIGLVPIYGLLVFLFMQRERKKIQVQEQI